MTALFGSILLTGATGFVGRAVLRELTGRGQEARCLLFAGRDQERRLGVAPGVTAVVAADSGAAAIGRALAGVAPDLVINLAAAGVHPGDRGGESLVSGNVGLVASLLEALRERPPRLILHAGSSAEYARADVGRPMDEDHPLTTRSPYGAAKAAACLLGHALADGWGLPFATLRLFHVFGEGEAPGRLLPHVITGLAAGREVELSGGDQIRDPLHVADVVEAFLAAARRPERVAGRILNVCSGRPASVREMCETVADVMDRPRELLRFGRKPMRADEVPWVVGDPSRFEAATGWRPALTLEQGTRRMVAALTGEGGGR